MPNAGQERFESIFYALEGNYEKYVDSSSLKRSTRIEDAFRSIQKNPFGLGWSGSGWVHSDFMQLAANLGLLAGVIFFLWYLKRFKELWRCCRVKQGRRDPLGVSLLLSFFALGAIFCMEGVQVLPQTMLPAWFVWCLAEVWLRQQPASNHKKTRTIEKESYIIHAFEKQ